MAGLLGGYKVCEEPRQPNAGKIVLFKLLYFMNFYYYELRERPLMGLTYER
jgi:hypothetical protein